MECSNTESQKPTFKHKPKLEVVLFYWASEFWFKISLREGEGWEQ